METCIIAVIGQEIYDNFKDQIADTTSNFPLKWYSNNESRFQDNKTKIIDERERVDDA